MTPATVSGCSTYSLCSTLPLPIGRTKLHLFLDDLCSPMLLVSVVLMIFSSQVHSSPVQSSPAIVDGQNAYTNCQCAEVIAGMRCILFYLFFFLKQPLSPHFRNNLVEQA